MTEFAKYRAPPQGYNGVIGLSCDFLYHLLSPDSVCRTSLEAATRLQVQLAVTLVHEMAHALYVFRGLPWFNFQDGSTEFFIFDTDLANEAGWSWENWVWNEVIISGCLDKDVVGPMRVYTWESRTLQYPCMYTVVPHEWLRDLFRRPTWTNITRHIDQLSRPVGRPKTFTADRWVEDEGILRRVTYVNGLATGEENAFFNDEEGAVVGNVERWFRRVRKADMRKALRTGRFYERLVRGPHGELLGKGITTKPSKDTRVVLGGDDADESSGEEVEDGADPPEREYEVWKQRWY